jgi:hypothetical protein
MTRFVVGAPAWDRAWSLPLWFESVRANVDPADTGLVFVVPAADASTREAIARHSEGFRWVEVIRDRGKQSTRQERPSTNHETLAAARNAILQHVARVRPERFVSWDTDLLVPPGTVDRLTQTFLPLTTVWTWMNRQPPQKIRHFDGEEYHEVWWQPPVCASAMAWDPQFPGRAYHYPGQEFLARSRDVWQTGVALAFKVMDSRAYTVASYAPHPDGEDVTFNWQLERRGVSRYCVGDIRGVHLYDRHAKDEIGLRWPKVMDLSQQYPLAAVYEGDRSVEYQAYGFYPVRNDD